MRILNDNSILTTDRETFKAILDDDSGFLTAPVTLARIGVQEYMGRELGLDDRALEMIGVFRSPEEVFHPDSIKSYVNLVVTDDHPVTFVSVDNVKSLQKGQVSQVDKADDVLSGVVTVTDKDQISKAKDGKLEVSVGYKNKLIPKKGSYDGVEYEFAQTDIRANHLAIVDAGRCGSACKITMDKQKKEMLVEITVNGMTFDVEKPLAQAIAAQQSTNDAEKEGLKKKAKEDAEEAKKEKEEMKKDKEKAEATADALKKTTLSDADVNAMVADRAALIADATMILGDKLPGCTDCPKEIKVAVIDAVIGIGDEDLSKKSMDYIDAMYDMALKQNAKAKGSIDKLSKDFVIKDADGKEITRDSARKDHFKELGMEV